MGRVWDLRTGRSIMLLRGHTQSVVSMDFSPNCYEIATGSADNSIRIHDIRKLKQNLHLIPAHTNLVSSVKYCKPGSLLDDISAKSRYFADYLVSSSFDGSVKVFSIGDYKPLKILKTGGANEKLFQMDVCTSGEYIAAASYDRTFKLWSKAS
jgi:U4/U6 small nuclear ribonucleoprotein PRP4